MPPAQPGDVPPKNENDKLLSEIFKLGESTANPTTSEPPKRKRKHRVFACDNCRKLKTKCLYESGSISCARCHRLRLKCSLAEGREVHNGEAQQTADHEAVLPPGQTTAASLTTIEQSMHMLDSKIDRMMAVVENTNGPAVSSRRILPRYDFLSPLNIISQIHSRVFDPHTPSDPFHLACQQFLDFYLANETLCLSLAKSFFEISHFWIIPGGISEIDRDYARKHPFSACVYVALAMGFDNDCHYQDQEKLLYPLALSIVANSSMAIPLSDHDIEALLYICTYGLTRRSSDQQGTKIDSWMLSSLGFNHCIVSLDLRNVLIRVSMGIFNDDDLFHLRIFNAICCCHYQFSVGYGRPVVIDSSYADLHKLILQFPSATVGDAIKVAELELYELLAKESGQDSIDDSYYESSSTSSPILSFSSLTEWRSSWEKIISKDITQGLNLSYFFSHIMKARRIIQEKGHQDDPTLPLAYNTACQYSFEIINRLLELPESSVRGTPSFHLSQIVYACATLFDFLDTMKPTERKMSLNLISKVYWHLNKSGEQINVATDTIARLIRKLVELASNHQPMEYKQTVGFVGTGSITEQYIRKRHIKRRDSQQQRRLSVEDLPGLAKGGRVPIKESPEPFSTTPSSDVEFQLPDVSNFENFEDFFYDIFKPEQAGL